jgi:hypothetical protein
MNAGRALCRRCVATILSGNPTESSAIAISD